MKDGKTNLEKKNPFNERYEDFKTFEKLLKRKQIKMMYPLL